MRWRAFKDALLRLGDILAEAVVLLMLVATLFLTISNGEYLLDKAIHYFFP